MRTLLNKSLYSSLLLIGMFSSQAFAGTDSNIKMNLLAGSQPIFDGLVSDIGAAISYKAVSPAEPMGLLGFDVGLEVSRTSLETNSLNSLTSSSAPSSLLIPRVHAHKGLPFGLDVGASITSIPDSNIKVIGAEVRYALMSGSTIMPAVAIRGSVSKLSGVDAFSLSTTGVEVTVSKGFLMLTPYAGAGAVRITGDTSEAGVSSTTTTEKKIFVGVNLNLGLLNIAAESEKLGDNSTTSIKFGFRF